MLNLLSVKKGRSGILKREREREGKGKKNTAKVFLEKRYVCVARGGILEKNFLAKVKTITILLT
jgi:hypothetical protein